MGQRAEISIHFRLLFLILPLIAGLLRSQPANVEAGIAPYGGRLVISQRSEPKTLNPLIAIDGNSREIIGLIMGDLIHINRFTQQTEPAVATSWTASPDGRRYTLRLRRGLRFSDGYPFDADDVLFTFHAYLDERISSPQRDLLVISGKPISVQKVDQYTVLFTLAQPYAAAERLFDSLAILPRHLLESLYSQGKLISAWGLNTSPEQIAGLGPFRLKEYVPGQRIVLQRNAYYWKEDLKGNRLPYLDEIMSLFINNADAEAMRFSAGDTDVITRLNAGDFAVLEKDQQRLKFHLFDLGPGLEYNFLVFNMNDLPSNSLSGLAERQIWFRQPAFRQAISSAIDRESIVRLAYLGRAYPLAVQVSPGNKLWFNNNIPPPSRSLERSRKLLRTAEFSWKDDGSLMDSHHRPVEFSIMYNAGRPQQGQMATLIQQDLKQLGIQVMLIPLEFRTLLDRMFTNYKYDAAITALADGDADPNTEMNVWMSNGPTHLWSIKSSTPPDPWQLEIDRLMQQQMTALDYQLRKRLFDQVQQLLCENVPVIFLVSPDILVGAKDRVGSFRPAILSSYALWNAEQLFIRQQQNAGGTYGPRPTGF